MFLTRLKSLFPVLLGFGTWYGKDPTYSTRKKKDIGPFYVAELSGGDAQTLLNLARSYANDSETTQQEKENNFFDMRLQAIAAAARNKRGYFLFDPMSVKDIQAVASYPGSVIENALDAISDLSGQKFLRANPLPEDDQENPS